MADAELGVALTVLRIVRGWSQEELAKASGIRSGSISDYERARMIPGLKTLRRLMGAMGYPLAVLDQTQSFIDALKADSLLSMDTAWAEMGADEGVPSAAQEALPSAVLRREIEQVSIETGRTVTRLTRLLLVVMSRPSRAQDSVEP
ncbi:MAG: helix-turn-helix domain-containing protein [Thermoanaerobaculia bacterium]